MILTQLEIVERKQKMHKIQPIQGSKTDGLEKTVAWTTRTLKTELRRKRYG
jgi:hypothetical protein